MEARQAQFHQKISVMNTRFPSHNSRPLTPLYVVIYSDSISRSTLDRERVLQNMVKLPMFRKLNGTISSLKLITCAKT